MIRFLTTFVLALSVSTVALGAGGGDENRSPSDYRKAVKAVKKEDYAGAVELLRKVVDKNPKNADAWNYMGYSLRNLQEYDEALNAYVRALEIKPKHKGALEYLGELYLQTNQPDKAREQLQKLDKACLFTCKEYRELKAQIAQYEGGP